MLPISWIDHLHRLFYTLLSFKLKAKGLVLNTTGVLVSLYTTSTSKEQLSKMFKLDDFYDYPVIKKVGKSEILKYFIKE